MDDKKIQKAAKLLVSDDSSYSLEDVRPAKQAECGTRYSKKGRD